MKKGQKVRVLADGRIGIVADSHFFHWGGKRMVQHQVKFPDTKGEAPWFPAEKLTTDLVERATVVFSGETGSLSVEFSLNREKIYSMDAKLMCTPENILEHNGLHVYLFNMLKEMLYCNSQMASQYGNQRHPG